jgi:hypothetical protein
MNRNKEPTRKHQEQIHKLKNGICYSGTTANWTIRYKLSANLIPNKNLLDITETVSLTYLNSNKNDRITMVAYTLTNSLGSISSHRTKGRNLRAIQSEPQHSGGPVNATLQNLEHMEPISITVRWREQEKGETIETTTLSRS